MTLWKDIYFSNQCIELRKTRCLCHLSVFEKRNYPDTKINIVPVFAQMNPGPTKIDIVPVFASRNEGKNVMLNAESLFIELNDFSKCSNIKWPVAPIMYDHGLFLRRVLIAMWCLGWLNFCLMGAASTAGMRSNNEKVRIW